MKKYTYQEAFDNSLKYFNGDELAASVIVNKYYMSDDDVYFESSPQEMFTRIAKEFFRIEGKYPNPMTEKEIYDIMSNWIAFPQGSGLFGIGNNLQYSSLANCYVVDSPEDSYGAILKTDQELIQIGKRRGGIGADLSKLRPEGTHVNNSAKSSTGIVSFMERFSNSIKEVAQCIAKGQDVLTQTGLKKIENISSGEYVWTKIGWVKVINVLKNKKEIFELSTNKGFKIRASGDHIFLSTNSKSIIEKKLSDFISGDKIVLIPGEKIEKPYVTLNKFEYVRKDGGEKGMKCSGGNSGRLKTNIYLPDKLDEDLSYFLGYSYGDGSIEWDRFNEPITISLACAHKYPEIEKKLINCCEKCFYISPLIKKGDGKLNKLEIHSKLLLEHLLKNKLLKGKSHEMIFPEAIMNSGWKVQSSFIAGYFDADGYASGKKKGYVFSSVNYDFIMSVKKILMANGILSGLHIENRKEKQWRDLYSVSITGTYAQEKLFEFMGEQSIKLKLKNYISKRDFCITPYFSKDLNIDVYRDKVNYFNSEDRISCSGYNKYSKTIRKLDNILVLDKIKNISNLNIEEETYDLVLEKENLFWCEGFYAHNSGRRGALLESLSVAHPDIFKFISSKIDRTKITGANISVKFTNEFMKAVKEDKEFILQFPVDIPLEKAKIKKSINARELWNKFIANSWDSAEPGCLFIDNIINNSTSDIYKDDGFETISTNPCLSGDTLVAVADGRHLVSIKQLAEEGKDIPVYCLDDKGKLAVRQMINPRITGENIDVFNVTLDDGSSFKCTKNHKLLTTDKEYKSVEDLKIGDSLSIIFKKEASIKDIYPKSNSRSQDYYWWDMYNCFNNMKADHRLIYEYYNGKIPKGNIIHHKDRNGKNNNIKNLEMMTKEAHNFIHSNHMRGKNNPIFKIKANPERFKEYSKKMSESCSELNNPNSYNVTSEDIFNIALQLTKDTGRLVSTQEWEKFAVKNNLPTVFSGFRKEKLLSVKETLRKCANLCGFISNIDPRTARINKKMIDSGYDTIIKNNTVFVKKYCEFCKKEYVIHFSIREQPCCSQSCAMYLRASKSSFTDILKNTQLYYKNKADAIKEEQLKIFTKLVFENNKTPKRKDFENECKKNNIIVRFGTKYGFKNYNILKETAKSFNHRIAKIEYIGKETVYNGTVDEFHNFCIGGWEKKQPNGKSQYLFLNNKNCGELPLNAYGSCILFVVNLSKFIDNPFTSDAKFNQKSFIESCRKAMRLTDDMVDLELEKIEKILEKIKSDPEDDFTKAIEKNLWEKVKEILIKGRRVGLGFTAFGDMLAMLNIKYDSDEAIKFTNKLASLFHETLMSEQSVLAKERGAFSIFDWKKEKNCCYIKCLSEETQEEIRKNGRRNISISTCAPAGTVSLLTQTTSGIEPVFKLEYKRRKKVSDEELKNNKDIKFTVDNDGIKWIEFVVEHHGLKKWKELNPKKDIKESPYFNCEAGNINWKQRIKIQSIWQKYITASISNTYNLPANITKEEVSQIYIEGWEAGLKGLTIYREGSRDGVLVSNDKPEKPGALVKYHDAQKRPKILPCEINYSNVLSKKDPDKIEHYIFFVGLDTEGKPYEIFGGKTDKISLPKKYKSGFMVKNGKNEDGISTYDLVLGTNDPLKENEESFIIKDINSEFKPEYGTICRMVSMALRHGVPVHVICEQLLKDTYNDNMFCFEKCVARILKKNIKDGVKSGETCTDCGSKMVYKDGCSQCLNCGRSKCS